jgi:hypothetical protein
MSRRRGVIIRGAEVTGADESDLTFAVEGDSDQLKVERLAP